MFPEPIRNLSGQLTEKSIDLSKNLFNISRTGLWVIGTSLTILVLPLVVEQERSSLEEQQAMQQRQILLGPSAVSAAGKAA
jgi:hypothetical protein